ncbi:oligopeptide/dipeptide ABC transporter ATP-binding protein [Miniphocaeibacter massiliensis]|uniref:oligopeptide/dipeptide ABC transporter ATP-binding protein n=1 Tax=Miniphocaeibacter massiliensis TaxID=2041841 RepID=UPI000C1BF04D|nr:ABC transporter ATP-binding protein [Miniphocaeibacter massiliensis]
MKEEVLIEIKKLKKYYDNKSFLGKSRGCTKAVDDIDMEIYKGETLGLVGESGSGKSTLGKLILGMEEKTDGEIFYNGKRKEIVFQDAASALNPKWNVKKIIEEPLKVLNIPLEERKNKVLSIVNKVGLEENDLYKYPHEFSGGQKQRICIARALVSNPDFIVCDEPIASLDVSIQAQIVNLLQDLQEELKVTYLFITHNIIIINYISDRIAVMYLGKIVEITNKDELYNNPLHPYTKMLIESISLVGDTSDNEAKTDFRTDKSLKIDEDFKGCNLYKRCKYAIKECQNIEPKLIEVKNKHMVACHLYKIIDK